MLGGECPVALRCRPALCTTQTAVDEEEVIHFGLWLIDFASRKQLPILEFQLLSVARQTTLDTKVP
jgi:hypothetical protein